MDEVELYLDSLPPAVLRCDIHTHLLPDRLATKIRAFFESHGMVCCPPPAGSSSATTSASESADDEAPRLIYPTDNTKTLVQLFNELLPPSTPASRRQPHPPSPYDGFRPLQLVTLPYAHTGDMSQRLNASIIQLSEWLTRDELWNARLRVIPGFTVHPADTSPSPVQVVEEALREGGKVMKLHCSVGKLSVADERLDGVWKIAEEVGFATVVHFGTSFFGTTEEEDLADLEKFVARYPKAKIIIAHLGHPSTELALSFSHHPSIYYDLTPVVVSPVLPPSPSSDLSSKLLDLALSGRILFGSDVPNVSIPVSRSLAAARKFFYRASRERGGSEEEWEGRAERALEEVLGKAAERLIDGVDPRRVGKARQETEVRGVLDSARVPKSVL